MENAEINLETNMDQILAENAGQSMEEYRADKTLRNRISEIAKGYIGKHSSEWPQIHFNWDVSAEGRRYSLDGASQKKFEKNYPEGFLLGQVVLAEFDRKLCHYSRRDEGEIWEVGYQVKLAFLIVYLSENRKISPPLVKPLETGEVIFNGGHHRYAIAKEIGVKELPIYVQPKYKSEIEAILNIEWKNA